MKNEKPNIVIHSKKLPESVANDRKNFDSSTDGKAMRAEAAGFQKKWQGSIDEAMLSQKRETGSTGFAKNQDYDDIIDETYDRNTVRTVFGQSGKRKPAGAKTYIMRRVLVAGKWQHKMVQVSGPRD